MRRVVCIDDRTLEGSPIFCSRGLWLIVLGLCCLTTATRGALAASDAEPSEPVELAWVRLEGAEGCPPRDKFISALEKRVNPAQFVANADRVLTIALSNEKGPFRAVLSLKSKSSDEVESKQELFSYSSSCDELFSATVLSVALLLNPTEFGNSEGAPIEEQDNGFFDAPPDRPLGIPSDTVRSEAKKRPSPRAEVEIPIAPRPWARSHAFIGAAALAAIEQLPTAGPGFAVRIEVPLDRAWLLWLEGDWLQAQPVRSVREPGVNSGITVTQDAGWVGSSWLPYNNDAFEFHVAGGLGFRRLQFTLTDDEPRFHLAAQVGIGSAYFLLPNLALQAQAAAVVPFEQEKLTHDTVSPRPQPTWTQPRVGGQLQLGFMIGIPGPSR